MARVGFLGLTLAGMAVLFAALAFGRHLPLPILLALTYAAFFSIGMLFGSLNAAAMHPLGKVAGLAVAGMRSLILAQLSAHGSTILIEVAQ